jgi:hypothetical protein
VSAEFDWSFTPAEYGCSVVVGKTHEPRSYKQYRRGGRMFWRNYGRDVPGGATFTERYGAAEASLRRAVEAELERQLERVFHV